MEQKTEMQMTIQIMDVVNKCLLKINSTYASVAHLYHAVKQFDESKVPPIETDNLPITISLGNDYDKLPSKEKALNWLFRKTFEDFIVGINESLIEAYRALKFSELAKRTKNERISYEQLQDELDSINKKPIKMHVPALIEEIEKSTGNLLLYKREILSINKVRNCLVHRNGTVALEDTNNLEKNALLLSCVELRLCRDKDGEMVPITMEDKKHGFQTTKVSYQQVPRTINYPIETHVWMDSNILNDVTYTSIVFVQELLKSLNLEGFTPKDIDYNIGNANIS